MIEQAAQGPGWPFWKTRSLDEMTREEWASLCDGCAICCLERVEDPDTGEVRTLSVSCEYLDTLHCRCMVYEIRTIINPDCIKLTPKNVAKKRWLPHTCAYRILSEGRDLACWHPLVSGNPDTVHEAGISIRERAVSGAFVHPDDIY